MDFGTFMQKNFHDADEIKPEHMRAFVGEETWAFLNSSFIKNQLHIELERLDMRGDEQDIRDFVEKHNCLKESKSHISNMPFPMHVARRSLGMSAAKPENLTCEQDKDYMASFKEEKMLEKKKK